MSSSTMSCAHIDNTFGPYAKQCRGGFDFTLFFEETILSILPLVIILLITPARIWYMIRRTNKVTGSQLFVLKSVRRSPLSHLAMLFKF